MSVFQYQARTFVFDSPVVILDTSTEWIVQHPIPVRRKRRTPGEVFQPTFFADTVFVVSTASVEMTLTHVFQYQAKQSSVVVREQETDQSNEWYVQHPIPVLRIPVSRTTISIAAERLTETDITIEWLVQHPIPVLRIPRMDTRFWLDGEIRSVPEQIDKSIEWLVQHPIPVLRIPSVASLFLFVGDIFRARNRVKTPPLVEHEPRADLASYRTIRHEQYVARIMNSLLIQGEIIQEEGPAAGGKWHLGTQPNNVTDWFDDIPPETLTEALDRIAEALRILGQKP